MRASPGPLPPPRVPRPASVPRRLVVVLTSLAALLPLGGCDVGVQLDPAVADRPLPRPGDPVDDALADAGAWLFRRNCSACHHIGEGSMIGPDLAGVTVRRDASWITAMIRRPDSMLFVDTIAGRLLAQYQVPMADRRLDPPRVRALLEFLRRSDAGRAAGAVLSDTTRSGIAWERSGSGPAVVLLPGTNLDRRIWDRVAAPLAGTRTVVRIDPRSHGASADASGPWSDVDDVAEVLDAAGVGAATLAGLSAGAGVALEFALAHPERVEGLVLVSPSIRGFRPGPGEVPDVFGPLMEALPGGDPTAIGDALVALPTFRVDPVDQPAVDAIVRSNLRLFRVDPTWMEAAPTPPLDRLGEVTVPTVVIRGGRDFPAVARLSALLVEGIAGAREVTVADGPHLLPFTAPGSVLAALTAGGAPSPPPPSAR